MNCPRSAGTLLCAALSLFLAGCEIMAIGGAASLAMAWYRGEGIRKYEMPYAQVSEAVVTASGALHLEAPSIRQGDRRTVIRGTDVDGHRVRIRAFPRDGGRHAEVRVRIGAMGEYVPTKVFIDTVNEQLGLPPEAPRERDPHLRLGY